MAKKFDPFDYPKGKIPKYYAVNNAVLFFDIVGFTKNTTNQEMQKIIQKIDNVINDLLWDDYNWNERNKHNDLILIPTGDGYGIGFHPNMSGDKILYITTELFKRISKGNNFKIRMGIAKGPNIRHVDRNDNINLFGYGINLASRVMTVALPNQVLIHEDFARELLAGKKIDGLIEIEDFIPIKHGEKIKVYNYYKNSEFGNPQSPLIREEER